jgi:uncharacterized OB-fold protein
MGAANWGFDHLREKRMSDPVSVASDSAPFWDGFKAGKLMLPQCSACHAYHLPAGPVCPYCLSHSLAWKEGSGDAVLSSWIVERQIWFKAWVPPYVVGEVQLAEGPRMPVQIDIVDLPRLALGAEGRIGVSIAPNGLHLPIFRIGGSR